jgi:hypothetical protein
MGEWKREEEFVCPMEWGRKEGKKKSPGVFL